MRGEHVAKIKVIGVGPGHPDYVLPIALRKIKESSMLIGGRRHLEIYGDESQQLLLPITAKIDALIDEIEKVYELEDIGVIVSGDPGFYSFLRTLRRRFSEEELDVYPGISAIQYLFSKGALPWNDAYVASFHGRIEGTVQDIVSSHKKVALFTDGKHSPNWIVSKLKEGSIQGKKILVGENLSYDHERITKTTLEQWVDKDYDGLNVMVIYDAEE